MLLLPRKDHDTFDVNLNHIKMKNWKTTSAGILMIAGGIVRFIFALKSGNFSEESILTTVSSILTGIGFLVSKDQNVTGGSVQQ